MMRSFETAAQEETLQFYRCLFNNKANLSRMIVLQEIAGMCMGKNS
jgi:hypothetical protein